MPLYEYKAIDQSGKPVRGSLDAGNVPDLEIRLEKMGLSLVKAKPKQPGGDLFGRHKITRRDLINFSFHLQQLAKSGVPILEGLQDLRDSEENPAFRDVIASLIEAVETGSAFSQALAMYPRVFDNVFVSLVKVGERSGRMAQVLEDITENLKWQDEIIAKAKKAVTYPAVIGTLIFAVIMFLMIFVVPDIISAIVSLGGEIPWYTQALMATSKFLQNYWYLVIAFPFVAGFLIRHYYRNNARFRFYMDGLLLRMWPFGEVNEKIKVSRFTRYFALMFASGITVLDAIKLSKTVVSNSVLEEGIDRAWKLISEGASISESFQNIGIFPPLVIRMLKVGESTGRMDESLENVSYFFERDINDRMDKMEPVLQTGLLVTIGGIVLWLIVAVFGPMYDTISTINF